MSMVIHFEIPADDMERARHFYSHLFGWEINEVPGRKNYCVISSTGEEKASSSLIKRFHQKQTTTVYYDVPSVDEYARKVQELGGNVVVPKKSVPKTGYFAICVDTENNIFGIWEEKNEV